MAHNLDNGIFYKFARFSLAPLPIFHYLCVTADNLLIPMRENDTTTEELYTQKGKTNRL